MLSRCVADKKYVKIERLRKLKILDDMSEIIFGESLIDKLGSKSLKKELEKLDNISELEKLEHFLKRNLRY